MLISLRCLYLAIGLIFTLSGPGAEPPRPVRPPIHLDPARPDPLSGLPPAPPSLTTAPSADQPALHLVQFTGPTRKAWLDGLRRAGLEVLQYVPRFAYAVHGTAEEVEAARTLAPLRWSAPFPAALKLPPAWLRLASGSPGGAGEPKTFDAVIQLFEGDRLRSRSAASFIRSLGDAGARVISVTMLRNRVHIRARVSSDLLAGIARWPAVFRVEPFPAIRLRGEQSAAAAAGLPPGATCVTPGYGAFLARKGLSGEGVIVQVADDGIEQGDASGVPGSAHVDLVGRIAGVDNVTSDPEGDSGSGHGSFNAALLAGTGASGLTDAAGFLPGQGVAPGARVFGTKIFNNLGRFDIGSKTFQELAGTAAERGCVVSTNSWGADLFGEYDVIAAEFDALARDVHSDPGDQLMTFIFAAGNEGDSVELGERTIGSPATAKNVISVGASEGCSAEPRDGCGVESEGADSLLDVVTFSSRGPLADGRLGPTLVAPGTQVHGIASTAAAYDGTGLCDRYWPLGQVLYARSSGTSHGCPIVAGAAALFHESRLALTGSAPSPALVKAALVAAARDLAGGRDGFGGTIPSVPNTIQGWGLVSMEDLVPDSGAAPAALYFDEETILGDTGDSWSTTAFPLAPEGAVKIVLAWSDPPALPGASPVLVNDLDLEVDSGGQVFRGNVFAQGASTGGGEADRLNNLEAVFLAAPAAVLRIRVTGSSISGDGVPAGDDTDQDFALVILGATDLSERGVVSFRRASFACDSIAALTLSDIDLKGRGAARVRLESTAASAPLDLDLAEVEPGAGMFEGSIRLGPGQGELAVAHGASITARYQDEDDGTGSPAESLSMAAVDCIPPAIEGVIAAEIGESSVRIQWETDEESSGLVRLGTECPASGIETPSPRRSRSHEVTIEGLASGTPHFFEVDAADAVGNPSLADRDGACFSFVTSTRVCSFEDDVEPSPAPGWTHSAAQGPDDWAPVTFPAAHSPTRAWHASAADGFKDASLVSPAFDITPGDRLSFWHAFQLELGFDGAVLEISTDGATWTDLGPAITRGGYVDIVSGSPLGDRMAWTGRRTQEMTPVEADLSPWVGPARRVRFRIASDASSVDGFGWFIDDIAICRSINKRGQVLLDAPVYRCGQAAEITVSDLDLLGAGAAEARISSASRPEPVAVALAEIQPAVFRASLPLDDSPGGFAVSHGDEILIAYDDADDGSATGPSAVTSRAGIDCEAPVISKVRVLEMIDDEAMIAWETDEPALGEVAAGDACDAPAVRRQEALGGTSHVVVLDGLTPGAALRYLVTARDQAGNVSVDDAAGTCRSFSPPLVCAARHDFDDGAPGWSHSAAQGADAWVIAGTPVARTTPSAWFLPGAEAVTDVSLISPFLPIAAGAYLSFWHTFDFEPGFDGGVIEISAEGGPWLDLGPEIRRGGYNAVLEAPNPIAGRPAWSGGGIGPMTRVLVGLSRWEGRTVRVRFRATSDGTVSGAGWFIDHFELCQSVRDEGRLILDRSAYPCEGRISIRVLDSGLASRGEIAVDLSSSSAPAPEPVRLAESPPGSGIFEGSILLGPVASSGVLQVLEGDAIQAVYRDELGAGGVAAEVIAAALVDCTAPVVTAVRLAEADTTSAVIEWTADEPSLGLLEAGTSCGAWTSAVPSGPGITSHRARIDGLLPGTSHFFRVQAIDPAGNTGMSDAGGACHEFRSRVSLLALDDDLEPAAEPGWIGEGRWRLAPSELARSPPNAWGIEGNGRKGDDSLHLPALPVGGGTVLEFFHTFELVEGRQGGVIEGSLDGGVTWFDVGLHASEGGYTGFISPGSPLEGRRAWTGGRTGSLSRVRIPLEGLSGNEVLIRLRWGSPGEVQGGLWIADDFRVSRPVSAGGEIAFTVGAHRCGSRVSLVLADSDLTNALRVLVDVTGTSQIEPVQVELLEDEPGSFRGSFDLTGVAVPGFILGAHGDALTALYRDERDDSGAPAEARASAAVDCLPPLIKNLRVGAAGIGGVEVLWETNEPTRAAALHGRDCADLASRAAGAPLSRSHRALLEGVEPGATAFLRVEAIDLAGNATTAPEPPRCAEILLASDCPFEDPFEPPQAGWTHRALAGVDDWRTVTFDRSRSPTRSFHSSNPGLEKDAVLMTPALEVPAGAVLTFFHTFELEEDFDGAFLEIEAAGDQWVDLGDRMIEGGYNGSIDRPGGPTPAWTGGEIGEQQITRVDLGAFAGPGRRVRFRIVCDDSVGTPGWFIDDVSLCAFSARTAEARFTRGNCNADARINISDAIFLLNHLFVGGPEPSCFVSCDTDSNDAVNITDAILLLNYLFLGGPPPEPPDGCEATLESGFQGCAQESCVAF